MTAEVRLRGQERDLAADVFGGELRDSQLIGRLPGRRPSRRGEDREGRDAIEDVLGARLGDVAVEAAGVVEDRRADGAGQERTVHRPGLVEEGLGAQDRLRRLPHGGVASEGAAHRFLEREAVPRCVIGLGRGRHHGNDRDQEQRRDEAAQTWTVPSAAAIGASSALRRTLPGARVRITT